jgi:hypothetical protein
MWMWQSVMIIFFFVPSGAREPYGNERPMIVNETLADGTELLVFSNSQSQIAKY